MTDQLDLFAPMTAAQPKPAQTARDGNADSATMERLHMLCSWAIRSNPGGWSMRQAWRATAPWQSMADAEKASRAASKRLERSKAWSSMTQRQRLGAMMDTEPFGHYTFRLGRATRTVMFANEPAKVSLRDVEESASELAAMCDSSAEVVVRYVLTGEVTA
jgi:hypothetical protein